MQPVHRAVIDVGTNSIKLLVAEVAGTDVRPLREESRQTRLGQGFYSTHRMQPGPIARTAEAVADFFETARLHGAVSTRVVATSAVRDALNAAELTGAIQQACGLPVEVISGEQEAAWAFRGATTDPSLALIPLLISDVGGGSAQFILGCGEHTHFSRSFALGTVRLLDKLPHSDPPKAAELAACRDWVRQFLETEVRPALEPAMRRERAAEDTREDPPLLVGTGGTASILGCMEAELDHFDRHRLEQTRLTIERLSWHTEKLWSLPLAQRKQIVGLPANRADVILMGSVIYEAVARVFGFKGLRISTRGLRFAAVLDCP